jgi:hypothetical protein
MVVHCTFCTVSAVQVLVMMCTLTAFSVVSGSLLLCSFATLSAVSDATMLCAVLCAFADAQVLYAIVGWCGVPFYNSVCSF